MIKNTKQYVQEYIKCQQKRDYYKKKIEHEIKRLEKIQKEVFIDYITKLLKIRKKNNILIIKDQESGIIHLKTIIEKENTKEV